MSQRNFAKETKAPVKAADKNGPKAFNADDYATATIPREEVQEIKAAFDLFDHDGSGSIDPL